MISSIDQARKFAGSRNATCILVVSDYTVYEGEDAIEPLKALSASRGLSLFECVSGLELVVNGVIQAQAPIEVIEEEVKPKSKKK